MADIDLATCAAGPRLASLLDRLDVARLDPEQTLAYVSAVRRQQAWTEAQLIRATARFATARRPPAPGDGEPLVQLGGLGTPPCGSRTPDLLGPDLRMSRPCAQRLVADALDLTHRLGEVWVALRLGLIDAWRARLLAEATRPLPAESAAAVGRELLGGLNRLSRGEIPRTVERISTGAGRGSPPDPATAP